MCFFSSLQEEFLDKQTLMRVLSSGGKLGSCGEGAQLCCWMLLFSWRVSGGQQVGGGEVFLQPVERLFSLTVSVWN